MRSTAKSVVGGGGNGWGKSVCIVKKCSTLIVSRLRSVKGLLKFGALFKDFVSLHKSIDIITQKNNT